MVQIFATGTTGYIGGDALYAIAQAHPEYEIHCLVRDSSKGALIASQYPNIKLVYGGLDSHDLLVDAASKADVVLNMADCDHEESAKAIVEGLARRESGGFLIHTSGTGILGIDDLKKGTAGQPLDKVYDDWDGIKEVTNLPDEAWHRNVDKIVLGANSASDGKVKTAIVCPPTIYGPGRGPGNQRSDQVYKMAEAAMKRGKGFVIGEGKNKWTSIHVHDLSEVFLKLTEAATEGGGKAAWNDEGYYFTENGEFEWVDVARRIAQEAKKRGYVSTAELDQLGMDEANEQISNGGNKWGLNSRCRAVRARKLFGWQPKGESLQSLLPAIVEQEARGLGLQKGHAEIAAGNA